MRRTSLSGSITQTAGQAELSHAGFGSIVGQTGTFTLSGSLGSVQISTTALQSLSTLATNVNQHTATTGVTAVVQGSQIKFRSTGVGSAATVAINVTSGSFSVTGGNGNGTANGTNAMAVVNGQTITGTGNQFQFTDALGTYTFTAASGFTGAFSTVSIESQAGSFQLSGGNGDGTATGLDALATINSVALTGVGNRFTVSAVGGQFELEFAAGFVGTFNNITVQSTPDTFDVNGGDGAGAATGADAVALINGLQHTSSDNRYSVDGAHGAYEIQFAADFEGTFDPVTIESTAVPLVTDAGEDGLASGEDIEAVINGREYIGSGSRVHFSAGKLQITLDFQAGFSGQFDPITATELTRTVTDHSGLLPAEDESADEPAADDRMAQLREELNELIIASKIEPLRGVGMESSRVMDPPSQADIVAELFNEIFKEGPLKGASIYTAPSAINPYLLRTALDLLA